MASNWFGEQQPLGANQGGQQGSARLSRIYGDQNVHFAENGHLIYPGQVTGDRDRPTNMLFWRQSGAPTAVNDNPNEPANNFRYRPWSQTVVAGPGDYQAAAPIITRRVDRFGAPNARFSSDGTHPMALPLMGAASLGAAATKSIKTTMTPETIVVEEMRVYDAKPCGWVMFLVVGLLLVAVGVLNGIFCYQYHANSFIWAGIIVIFFAIVCAIHRGDYFQQKWKSWLVIVVGFLATVMVSACSYLLLVDYCHQVIDMIQFTSDFSLDYYISVMEFRFAYYNTSTLVKLGGDMKYNIWLCFSLDTLVVIVICLAFGVLTTTLYVVDRFYNSHYVITKKVEPFCKPWLFNPWGQCSLGQAMIIVGCVVGSSEFGVGNTYTSWFIYYAPVWAGTLPVIAGILSALALKNCGSRQRGLVLVAAIFEMLSLLASVVAIILSTLLLIDNIVTLKRDTGVVMVVTPWSQRLIIASSILESISDAVCLVNVFYSLTHFARLLACLQSKNQTEQTDSNQFVLGDSENAEPAPKKSSAATSAVVTPTQLQQPKVVAPVEMPIFQPYRPMGMARSYWAR